MKKITALLSALALICCTASCTAKPDETQSGVETVTVSQTIYKEDRAELPKGFGYMDDMSYVEGKGMRIAYGSGDKHFFADYDEDLVASEPVEFLEAENVFSSRFCIAPDGSISAFIIYAVSPLDISDPDYYNEAEFSLEMRRFSPDGEELETLPLEDTREYYDPLKNFCTFFCSYGEKWIIGYDEGRLLIDSNGEVESTSEESIDSNCYGIDSDGRYIYAASTEYGYMDGTTLKEPQTMESYGKFIRMNRGFFAGQGDYKAFFIMSDGIFGLTESGSVVELLDFLDSHITLSEVYQMAYVAEGKFALYGADDAGVYLSLLTVRPDDYVENKQKVVLGVATNDYGYDSNNSEMANKYNKKSDSYEVEIRTYSLDLDDVKADILSDNAPDVYSYGTRADMMKLVNLGAAANMDELAEKYGGLTRNDLLDNVAEALSYKDGLYAVCQTFQLPVAIGKQKFFPKGTMTYDEFFGTVDNMPEGMYFGNNDFTMPEQVFYFLCTNNLTSWMDFDKGECWFDSPEFVQVLEFTTSVSLQPRRDWAAFYETATDDEARIAMEEELAKVKEEKALLANEYLFNLAALSRIHTEYDLDDSELTLVTPPSFEPKGRIGTGTLYSVINNGKCTEGGWDFVNFIMSDNFLRSYLQTQTSFVCRKESFDKILEEGQKISWNPVYVDEAGVTHNNYAYGEKITDEQLANLREYLSTCTLPVDYNDKVSEIIMEEYNAYLAGDVSAERCAELIQNRMSIYLSENS